MKELEEWSRLHRFFKYSDYSTKDLADFLKVSPRTIQRWLKGKTKPDGEKLKLIKAYLSAIPIKDSQDLSTTPPSSRKNH